MLEINNIHVAYDSVDVLQDVSLRAEQGQLTLVLGANGSGKSTLFRTISGLIRPHTGSIEFLGDSIVSLSSNRIVRTGIAQSPEGRHLFPMLSVMKNLSLGNYVLRSKKAEYDELLDRVFQLFPILKEKRNQTAGSLSGGQQQMVAIGRALMSNPKLLILDEPSIGLAPLVTEQVFEAVTEINKSGTGVLLAEQNARLALKIATYGYVLAEGRVVLSGPAHDLRDDPEVQKAYLGL
ncbi:ABC transporter ATP-binding protein [Auritidibacter ignavus]|uniref:ABC transporter ATP-binding protein n=1 Tax=Auritidibacter ignavus TaxID=678932 RepID=UPI002447F455|nr:ABC transporter ATP-binding protein [Auritidibacter ignavus]WGH90102.1 ABC transporter ATP-binding protein [Auritidibacter ignavus]WHS36080.1 ABC transporter ATP-binding protein [Auritidibacter ignavus]